MEQTCSICLEPLFTNRVLRGKNGRLIYPKGEDKLHRFASCGHQFHYRCLKKWFYTPSCECEHSKACPLCRKPLFAKKGALQEHAHALKDYIDVREEDKHHLKLCIEDAASIRESEDTLSHADTDSDTDSSDEEPEEGDTYICEFDCGFRGDYQTVAEHELTCSHRDGQCDGEESDDSECTTDEYTCEHDCGFLGSYQEVAQHEKTCCEKDSKQATVTCDGCGTDQEVRPDPGDPETMYCPACLRIVDQMEMEEDGDKSEREEDIDESEREEDEIEDSEPVDSDLTESEPEDSEEEEQELFECDSYTSYNLDRLFHHPDDESDCPTCLLCGTTANVTTVVFSPDLMGLSEDDHSISEQICLDCIENNTFEEVRAPPEQKGFYLSTRRLSRFSGIKMSHDDRMELPTEVIRDWVMDYYVKYVLPKVSVTPVVPSFYKHSIFQPHTAQLQQCY